MIRFDENDAAIAIMGTKNHDFGIFLEYYYLEKLFGIRGVDWDLRMQSLFQKDGKWFDKIGLIHSLEKNAEKKNDLYQAIFGYFYAILHSPTYRSRYAEFLKIDFPRIPLTSDKSLFAALAGLDGVRPAAEKTDTLGLGALVVALDLRPKVGIGAGRRVTLNEGGGLPVAYRQKGSGIRNPGRQVRPSDF